MLDAREGPPLPLLSLCTFLFIVRSTRQPKIEGRVGWATLASGFGFSGIGRGNGGSYDRLSNYFCGGEAARGCDSNVTRGVSLRSLIDVTFSANVLVLFQR